VAAAWWWSWLLAGVGLTGLWIAGSRNAVGWAIGVAAQVLWIAYALATDQPGFLISAAGYGFVHARNWWRWRTQTGEHHDRPTGAVEGRR
jgi:hypothetical protein